MQKARYLAFSYDEFMMINNQSWCNSHVYVVDGFKKMPFLLNLERVVGKGITNNLTTLILKSLMEYGDLIMDQIGNKFIYFGVNGVAMFTSLQTSVTIQLRTRSTPFFIPVHYMAHQINLDFVKTLFA